MTRLPTAPRLSKIDPAALREETEELLRKFLEKYGVGELPPLARQYAAEVEAAARWAQRGEGPAPEIDPAGHLLRIAPIGMAPLPHTDPDRLEDDFLGRLALVQVAVVARLRLRGGLSLSAGEVATLASMSARQVRNVLRVYQDKAGMIPADKAAAYLAAIKTEGAIPVVPLPGDLP